MKKLFILSLMVFSLNAFAYECAKKELDPCAYDADLFKKCEEAYFVNGEFLYWSADATNLEYAVQNNSTPPAGTTYAIGNYEVANYDWDPGFRISAGWFNAPKYWQAFAQFTWIKVKGSDKVTTPTDVSLNLNSIWPQPATITSRLNEANSRLELKHELGDLMTTRVFMPNPHLRMRMIGGFTGGRLRQEWLVNYIFASDTNTIFNKWKFLAGGLRLGLDFDWFWGNDFYITAKATTAALIGKYKNYWKMDASTSGASEADVKFEDYRIAYNTQFLFGFSYQKSFTSNRLEIFAGYELNSFYNLHEIIKTTGDTTVTNPRVTSHDNGTLSMHGLTTRFTLDF